jgi:hypothetical protein
VEEDNEMSFIDNDVMRRIKEKYLRDSTNLSSPEKSV